MRSWILAALLAASALVVSACVTEQDRENLQSLVDDLSSYEQVDEADGGVRASGTDKNNTVAVVLQGDASVEEVAEIIDAVDDLIADHDVEGLFTLRISSEAARHDGEPALELSVSKYDDPDATALAQRFVDAIGEGLPEVGETRIGATGQVTLIPWENGTGPTAAAVHMIAKSPVLSTWETWQVSTRPDGVRLSAQRIDAKVAKLWDGFLAPFEGRDDVRMEAATLTLRENLRRIQIYLSTVPAADPKLLRRSDEQQRLWPVLRGELDVLQEIGGDASLDVNYSLADAPKDVDRAPYDLLDVALGQPVPADPYGRGWDVAAGEHLGAP